MTKNQVKNVLAFTLIEILIAIAVFSVGILVVLRLITWNMAAIDRVKIKTQATILAKEWVDLVYNLRDANKEKEQAWNCVFSSEMYYKAIDEEIKEIDICNWYLWRWQNKVLQISFDPKIYLLTNRQELYTWFDDNFAKNILYYKTNEVGKITSDWWYETKSWYNIFWYSNDSDWNENWQETNFARYIVLTWIVASWELLDKNKILKLESHVLYKKWNYTWEVILESFIGDY